jgi:hypothetical protein
LGCEPFEYGGYVVALEPPSWTFRKQVELTLESGQTHGIRPGLGTVSVFAGARVDIQVPSRVYANEEMQVAPKVLDNLDDSIAGDWTGFTRRSTSLGFTVIGRTSNTVSEHANATHFSFVVAENTVIRANWLEEYLLEVSATEPSGVLKGPVLGGFGGPIATPRPEMDPQGFGGLPEHPGNCPLSSGKRRWITVPDCELHVETSLVEGSEDRPGQPKRGAHPGGNGGR